MAEELVSDLSNALIYGGMTGLGTAVLTGGFNLIAGRGERTKETLIHALKFGAVAGAIVAAVAFGVFVMNYETAIAGFMKGKEFLIPLAVAGITALLNHKAPPREIATTALTAGAISAAFTYMPN